LRWRQFSEGSQDQYSSVSNVDYFVVSCLKQGKNYVCGNCHGGPGNTFRFIDFANKNFVGEISYYVTPVMLDGSRGKQVSLGTIRQIDRRTEFLKRT